MNLSLSNIYDAHPCTCSSASLLNPCKLIYELIIIVHLHKLPWLNGRASVFGTEGCGFESRREYLLIFFLIHFIKSSVQIPLLVTCYLPTKSTLSYHILLQLHFKFSLDILCVSMIFLFSRASSLPLLKSSDRHHLSSIVSSLSS